MRFLDEEKYNKKKSSGRGHSFLEKTVLLLVMLFSLTALSACSESIKVPDGAKELNVSTSNRTNTGNNVKNETVTDEKIENNGMNTGVGTKDNGANSNSTEENDIKNTSDDNIGNDIAAQDAENTENEDATQSGTGEKDDTSEKVDDAEKIEGSEKADDIDKNDDAEKDDSAVNDSIDEEDIYRKEPVTITPMPTADIKALEDIRPELPEYVSLFDNNDLVALTSDDYPGILTVTDISGSETCQIDLNVISKLLKSKNLIVGTYYDIFVSGGVLYTSFYGDYIERYKFLICAVDLKSYEVALLWEDDSHNYHSVMDVYEGILYLDYETYYKEYDYSTKGNDCECRFRKLDDGFAFIREQSDISRFIDSLSDYWLYRKSTSSNNKKCYYATLMENGFLIGGKDEDYYILSPEKDPQKLVLYTWKHDYVNEYPVNYNGEYLVTQKNLGMDYKYTDHSYWCYDLKDMKAKMIFKCKEGTAYLGMDDSYVYYSINVNPVFSYLDYIGADDHIYRYDMKSGISEEIYNIKWTPGTDIVAGRQDLMIADKCLYYIGVDGSSLRWQKTFDAGEQINTVSIGDEIEHLSFLDYGDIEYKYVFYRCEECEGLISFDYINTFVLNSQYSAFSEKINEALRDEITIEGEEKVAYIEDEYGDCNNHIETDYTGRCCTFYYSVVKDVNIINDNYLVVHFYRHAYPQGAAHGQSEESVRVFSLEDGTERNFEDIYEGSFEDFYKMVAAKPKE